MGVLWLAYLLTTLLLLLLFIKKERGKKEEEGAVINDRIYTARKDLYILLTFFSSSVLGLQIGRDSFFLLLVAAPSERYVSRA